MTIIRLGIYSRMLPDSRRGLAIGRSTPELPDGAAPVAMQPLPFGGRRGPRETRRVWGPRLLQRTSPRRGPRETHRVWGPRFLQRTWPRRGPRETHRVWGPRLLHASGLGGEKSILLHLIIILLFAPLLYVPPPPAPFSSSARTLKSMFGCNLIRSHFGSGNFC